MILLVLYPFDRLLALAAVPVLDLNYLVLMNQIRFS